MFVALLDFLGQRLPRVANDIGREDVPSTHKLTERAIKAFQRHYRRLAGFESIETARTTMTVLSFFYRMTPWPNAIAPDDCGKCPVERAGWQVRGVPVADSLRGFTKPEDPGDPHGDSPKA